MASGGIDVAAAEAAYEWIVGKHPAAPIALVAADGLMVPLPADFDPGAHVVLKGRSALDFVQPADRLPVVAAWERARAAGLSRVLVTLVSGEAAFLHFFDLRHRFGTYLAVFGPADGEATAKDVLEGHDDRSMLPPRVCRLVRDEVAVITEIDESATQLLGWRPDELVGRRSIELVHPDDLERAIANWMEMLDAPHRPHRWRGRYQCADGTWLWLDITNVNRLEDPLHGDVVSEMVDIADEMAVHEVLREREQLLRRLTDSLPSAVLQFDARRRAVHVNEQLHAMVGEPTIEGLLRAVDAADRPAVHAALDAVLREGMDTDLEVRLVGDRVCRVALRALTDDHGGVSGGFVCADDVTEATRLRHQLELRATFDGLTACYSRTAILGALEDVGRSGQGTGVVFVDLDRFKHVNDEHGHAVGDELLAVVAARLRAAVRDVDLVGRLGGDEFLIVCPGVRDADEVEAVAARVADRVSEPIVLAGAHPMRPQASIGTAWGLGPDVAALVARADAAMYLAKRR